MKAWAEAAREALKLISRLADHIEARRTAQRKARAAKTDIDLRHVPPEKSKYAKEKR